MTEHKYVGKHLDDLADGRVLVPGQTYELDDAALAEPHNVQRIDEGLLIPVQTNAGLDATDEAVQLAAANGVDLRDVTGTGQNGRIVKSDVEKFIATKEGND